MQIIARNAGHAIDVLRRRGAGATWYSITTAGGQLLTLAGEPLGGSHLIALVIGHISLDLRLLVHWQNESRAAATRLRLQQAEFDITCIPMDELTLERSSRGLRTPAGPIRDHPIVAGNEIFAPPRRSASSRCGPRNRLGCKLCDLAR